MRQRVTVLEKDTLCHVEVKQSTVVVAQPDIRLQTELFCGGVVRHTQSVIHVKKLLTYVTFCRHVLAIIIWRAFASWVLFIL